MSAEQPCIFKSNSCRTTEQQSVSLSAKKKFNKTWEAALSHKGSIEVLDPTLWNS